MSEDPDKIQEEENELYEHYNLRVDNGQGLLRIDKFLMNRIENASRTKIQQSAKAGNILVNHKAVRQNYKVKPGDSISIVLSYPPREIEVIPEDIPLEIVYEDGDLLFVNKPPGMVVHPAYANYTGTLVNALAHYLQKASGNEEAFPLLVHRIDKDTSGIMVVAKNELMQTRLARMFFDHAIERTYQALIWGNPEKDQGTITGHIARSMKDRKVFTVYPAGDRGKHAITHYRVLKRFRYVTLVECRLETGRTHQIRVHFKHIGHPLFGDKTYGGDKILKGTTFTKYRQFISNCFKMLPRQALHAKSLGFLHPISKKEIFIDSDLPEDMKQVVEKWEKYTGF